MRNAPLSLLIAFQYQTNSCKTIENLASQNFFALVHTLSLSDTLLRALSHENPSLGHVFTPFFQNTSFTLFDFILEGHRKIKHQIQQQS